MFSLVHPADWDKKEFIIALEDGILPANDLVTQFGKLNDSIEIEDRSKTIKPVYSTH